MARALALMFRNDVEAALPSLQRAYNIYVSADIPRSQALALQNIGSIYLVARDYAHALRYYTQAQERFPGDPLLLMAAHANRGQALMEMGNIAAASDQFATAVRLAAAAGNRFNEQRYLTNLAHTQLASGDIGAADASLARGYELARGAAPTEWSRALDWVGAEIALKKRDRRRAVQLTERIFANNDIHSGNVAERDWLRTAYEVYKASGDDRKALTYLEAYKQADDKARSLAASAGAALMSARFDFVNQQAQIQQLHATQIVQEAAARARLRSTILKAVLGAGGIVFGLLLFGFFSIRRSRDQVRAANDDLSTSNVALEQALAARTEFLAMTSHEIRTPLNGILGMTQVLLADRALALPVRDKIELVHGAGEAMKSLVDDLLDVAKMTTGEISIHKTEMDLARLLRDAAQVWGAQAEANALELVLAVDQAPPRIVGDEVRLRQIVFNLMSNAIKFTDRGEVRLTATVDEIAGGGERLRLAITDSGIGIPAAQLEEIFESFRQVDSGVTRRHGGTGLGLSICRSLARAMGGDVTVTSVIGVGSTFTIDLPLERVAIPQPAEIRTAAPVSLGQARVLLVEANPISQSVMRSVLGAHVAGTLVAATADDAECLLQSETVDLVLADGATLGLDIATATRLAQAAVAGGGRMALLWPAPDEAVRSAIAAQDIALLIAKPISAVDLVAAVKSLYAVAPPDMIAA